MATRRRRSLHSQYSGSSDFSMQSRSDVGMSLKLHDLPIFGRDAQLETIDTLYNEGESRATIVAIHGKAGSGKSALIESNRQKWSSNGCLFAYGRFDQNRSEPFSGIIDALRDLINNWASTDEGVKEIQGFAPKAELDKRVLRSSVPQLCEIHKDITGQNKTSQATSITKKPLGSGDEKVGDIRRVTYQLLSFLCAKSRRVVVFLDDIEWADTASCEFLDLMAKHSSGFEGLLIAVSYEDQTLDKEHPVGKTLSRFDESTWQFCKIHVPDLDLYAVNQIVSTVTKADPEQTIPLSEVVLKKAGGNSFFVLQFLRLLEEEKFLHYSFNSFKWEWGDVTTIERSMNVSDDVADIVAISMRRLESETRQVLMIASCFGDVFPHRVLINYLKEDERNEEEKAEDETDNDPLLTISVDSSRLEEILDSCVKAGILGQRHNSKPYAWLHDKLQRVAYSMIPKSTRCAIHLRLGHLLLRMTSDSATEDWIVYMAATQFNRTLELRPDPLYAVEIANLNLRAAELSISKSAFYPAIDMLQAGLRYLDEKTHWEEHYDLTLEIYSSLAETNRWVGNHDEAVAAVNEVLANAEKLEDKFRAQHVQLRILANSDYESAIQMALDILDDYNEHIPRKPNRFHLFISNHRLKSLLPETCSGKLLELPVAVEETAIIIGKLLCFVTSYAIVTPKSHSLAWLAMRRSLCWSCEHGVTAETIRTLMSIAILLKDKGRLKESCDHVDLAVELCNQSDKIPDAPLVFVKIIAYAAILPLVRPFHECLEQLLEASLVGYRTGEIEFGAMSGFAYCLTYFCIGLPLAPMAADLISFGNDAHQFALPGGVQALFHMLRQTILNLDANSDNSTLLKGEAFDQEEMLSKLEGHGLAMAKRDIDTFRLILSCIFRDLDTAEAMIESLASAPNTDQLFCRIHVRMVFMGLAALALGRQRRLNKYIIKGREILKQIRSQVKKGSTNAHPILLMLEAEEEPSKSRFDNAISACARSGLIHYQAYMYESAGLYFLELKDEGWGEFYLQKAMELYQDWGASKKVKLMKSDHPFLATSQLANAPSTSLKGRSRHQNVLHECLSSFKKFNLTV